jgi:hypothetical protein
MKRRQFISLLGGASLSMRSMIALAETNGRMPKVAVLIVGNVDDPESTAMISAFEGGMRAAGWTKDVNVHLDYRRGGTVPQHAALAAAEVAASKPDVDRIAQGDSSGRDESRGDVQSGDVAVQRTF